ncbi:hypothetical protein M514_07486 [Trichuris suis]|uniref:Uncharacterized protein n=1 Tax=Trichuris suis TaxID=68888 RepID=A0A085NE48_9BILA|nr:hypothetical protein M513_07486 [Trichuris suis]KFD67744.1 hypothetical protein M514_07486 [Trichuris suis]
MTVLPQLDASCLKVERFPLEQAKIGCYGCFALKTFSWEHNGRLQMAEQKKRNHLTIIDPLSIWLNLPFGSCSSFGQQLSPTCKYDSATR